MSETKMLMIVCAEEHLEQLLGVLEGHHLEGFTELRGLQGAGVHGRRLGTRAFPGSVSLIFSVASAAVAEQVTAELRRYAEACGPEAGLHVYALDADRIV
ncbi:MAG: hypothetical protein HC897_03370 [Thermoanaerobaculia bacterium]|nr:hypothetical protein [Thermoanaerobaculia bacterium]